VGIITWGDLSQTQSDLALMTSAAAMNPVNVKVVPVTLGTAVDFSDDPDSDTEWNLDSQSITGTSGGVKQLIFYTAANGKDGPEDEELTDAGITAAYNQAVVDDVAKVINVSLGEDETGANQSGTQQADDAVFAQAASQGQTFSVASGDQGVYVATGGDFADSTGVVLPSPFSLSSYSVSEPATSPNVISVGGTEVSTNGTAWAGEVAWNDGVEVDTDNGNNRIWATGGGKSLFEAAPTWQQTVLNVTTRSVPDIAYDASSVTGAVIFIGGQRYSVGGTSLASPIFVGVFARVQTYANNSIGFPANNMYQDFPNNPAVLHDVTSGNNGVSYQGKTYGYNAATGWDYTTGFGSLDISKFNALAYTWGDGTPPTTTPPPAAPTVLKDGVAVTTQGPAGSSQQFTLVVPAGATSLTLRTSGGSGDVTLYVKRGSAASASSYDYVSAHPSTNTEAVTMRSPVAGTYYLTVTSPGVFTGVSVEGLY
jgi:xanthomonalisin